LIIGSMLGPLELLLGAVLISGVWSVQVGAITVGLLCCFTLILVRTVLTGRRVSCNCFGNATNHPVTWATVARNVVLIGLGLVVALTAQAPHPSVLALTQDAWRTHRTLVRLSELLP